MYSDNYVVVSLCEHLYMYLLICIDRGIRIVSVVSICQSKGGSGKTTLAQIILGTLARDGYRVAAIDADFNHTLSTWVSNFSEDPIEACSELREGQIVPLAGELE